MRVKQDQIQLEMQGDGGFVYLLKNVVRSGQVPPYAPDGPTLQNCVYATRLLPPDTIFVLTERMVLPGQPSGSDRGSRDFFGFRGSYRMGTYLPTRSLSNVRY